MREGESKRVNDKFRIQREKAITGRDNQDVDAFEFGSLPASGGVHPLIECKFGGE